MSEIKIGEQFRIKLPRNKLNDCLLTIDQINEDEIFYSVLVNNKTEIGSFKKEDFKKLLGSFKLIPVSLNKVNTSLKKPEDNEILNYTKAMYEVDNNSDIIEVKKTEPYGGFYSDPNDDEYYKDAEDNIYTKIGEQWYICTDEGEADYPIHKSIVITESINKINESKFGRVMGKFMDYTSKVISGLKRNNVDENLELNLSLISNCFSQGMSARDCTVAYLKNINGEGTIVEENSDNYDQSYTDEKLNMKESTKKSNLRLIGEAKNNKMENKKQLNETSFTFNNTSKFILNYEDQDIVKGIKELFKDYEGFTCNKISAVGDTQFYNVEITSELEDEYKDIEQKRFLISQKIHKFRAEFFTDLSSIFPVVNMNMGNYEFVKNSDKIKFTLTILMSATNQRDWVSGEYKQKDKKLGQKIIDSLEKTELKESFLNSKLTSILSKKNVKNNEN